MSNFTYADELYHYGVLGMKWGIRRYQNEDGTRTEAGKRRYAKLNEKVDRIYERKTADLRKIVNDPVTYKNKYNRDRAQLEIDMETKLRDLRKAEIEEGYNYLENRMTNRSLGTWLVGGLPLAAVNAGYDLIAHNDQWKARSEIKKEYKSDAKALKEQNIKEFNERSKLEQKESSNSNGSTSRGFTEEQKTKYRESAKEDRYNIDFLEAIQNSKIFNDNDKKSIDREYEKFLEDPEKYWTVESLKLKQA